jgi:prefoldin subunit 5
MSTESALRVILDIMEAVAESRKEIIDNLSIEYMVDLDSASNSQINFLLKKLNQINKDINKLKKEIDNICIKINEIININKRLNNRIDTIHKDKIMAIITGNNKILNYLLEYYDNIDAIYIKIIFNKQLMPVNVLDRVKESFFDNLRKYIDNEIVLIKNRFDGVQVKTDKIDKTHKEINKSLDLIELKELMNESKKIVSNISPITA